jgi:hypothetical protein
MTIDKSGHEWLGSGPEDIDAYLKAYSEDSYPVGRCIHARCSCGGDRFRLEADAEEGAVKRTCTACGASLLMLDSAEFWGGADPEPVTCACGAKVFEVAVGFSFREDGTMKWVTVGNRCLACGILGAPAEWKIDGVPSDHLYEQV